MIAKYPDKSESGCKICLGNAKLIFASKEWVCQALKIISNSKRLKPEIIRQCEEIMKNECC